MEQKIEKIKKQIKEIKRLFFDFLFFRFFNVYKANDGVVLIISVALLGITFSIAFGIFTIFYSEYKLTKTAEYSTIAIYAADAGIERALYNYRILETEEPAINGSSLDFLLDSGALFRVVVEQDTPTCAAGKTCVRSRGCFYPGNAGVDITTAILNCDSKDSINRSIEAVY